MCLENMVKGVTNKSIMNLNRLYMVIEGDVLKNHVSNSLNQRHSNTRSLLVYSSEHTLAT